jgi:hypothetical protein
MRKKLQIVSPTTAKELMPPVLPDDFTLQFEIFRSLKEYKIKMAFIHQDESGDGYCYADWSEDLLTLYPIGTSYHFEVDDNNLTCILL